ncbi:MAG: PorP/SprF family type IX secretion system membrane protein [Bacteroidota bacterium]
MRKIYIIIFLVLFAATSEAQDIHFSQLSQTPLLINPAAAGAFDGYYRGILNYKSQWASMGKPYSTFMGSFDMPFEKRGMTQRAYFGLGAHVYSDKAGDAKLSTTSANVATSCIVSLGAFHKLSAGLAVGFTLRHVDIAAIKWPSQYDGSAYDPSLPSNEPNRLGSFYYFDMSTGIYYQFLKPLNRFHGREIIHLTVGAAMFHAATLFQNHSGGNPGKVSPRFVVNTSLRYDIQDTRIGLVPSVLYMWQGPAYELDLGFLIRLKTSRQTNITGFLTESAFSAGLHYRYKDAIIPQVFFEIANFGIGISYDINISSFAGSLRNKGGLEFSVRYSRMKGPLYKNRN